MGRPERPLDGSGGPIAAFAYDLRALRKQAGNPSYRELARTALFAPSVLSSAASGYRLPTLPVTLGFVTACHGDRDAWEQRWREVAQTVEAADPRGELPRPFEQAASSLARPAQLPMGAGVFVGRKPTLAGAAHVIGQPGPVRSPIVICGPIGVGKSAFALRLADQVAAQFPDGQLYADLSTYPVQDQRPGSSPADSVVRGFLRAMGVPASLLPPEETHRIGLYRSLLAERRLFVLLENPRNERWVRTLVGRTANSQVVVTSRARLLGLDGAYRSTWRRSPVRSRWPCSAGWPVPNASRRSTQPPTRSRSCAETSRSRSTSSAGRSPRGRSGPSSSWPACSRTTTSGWTTSASGT